MVETLKIAVNKTKNSRLSEVNFENLPFGKVYADHMFMADFRNGDWRKLPAMWQYVLRD